MKTNFEKVSLFACPIYKIRIDPNSYDKEKMINDIKYNKSKSNTRNNSKTTLDFCDIHHGYKDEGNKNFRPINYKKLNEVYNSIFTKFFNEEVSITADKFDWQSVIVNYAAMTKGQYLPIHDHLGQYHPENLFEEESTCDFSTVHYLNYKKEHTLTRFTNPAYFSRFLKWMQPRAYSIVDRLDPTNSYLFENFYFPAEEDDIIIFPAALMHEVIIQGQTDEPRITISTNISVKKET